MHLAIALIVVGTANVVIVSLLRSKPTLGAEFGIEAAIVAIAVALPVGLTVGALWPQLRLIFAIVEDGPRSGTRVLLGFVREELRELEERVADIRSGGLDLERGVVSAWVRARCFAVGSGSYRATDVLVPSRFLDTYSEYLDAHALYIHARPGIRSVRVNVAARVDLERDTVERPDTWAKYQDWHTKHGVTLLHCDEAVARDTAQQEGLGSTVDVAFWEGELALLVEYHSDGKTNLRIALVGEPWYRRCQRYLQRIEDKGQPFASLGQGHEYEDDATASRD